jgi:hypothetical protein
VGPAARHPRKVRENTFNKESFPDKFPTVEAFLRNLHLTKTAILMVGIVLMAALAFAQEKRGPSNSKRSDESERFFDLKVPDGFKEVATDEPGMLKWRKNGGEIYIAVGDVMFETGDKMIDTMRKAVEKNIRFEGVKTLRLRGGRALLYKEKAPEDPGRLRSWHMLVAARKKVVLIDFTAPQKDFDSYVPAFEQAVKSFKLKPSH